MKRKIGLIAILVGLFIFSISVQALEYGVGKLIPVNELATVHTEKFDYMDFSYNSTVNEQGNGVLSFQKIRNNGISKTAVSMNILLFDKNKKNIGLISYCSDKDSGEKSGFKISGGGEVDYSLLINSNYIVDGKSPEDVSFIAVYDDNSFCSVNDKDKYVSQSIEEIMGEETVKSDKENFFTKLLKNENLVITIVIVISVIVFLALFGLILNVLYPKMYADASYLVFIPLANFFICVRMAFGLIVAFIYLGLLLVAGVLYFFHIPIVLYIMGGFTLLAFIIDIIKIFTKNYNLFYLEPHMDDPTKKNRKPVIEEQEPLDLNYTSEGLNAEVEEDPIKVPDPLEDVYDDVVSADREESCEDDFYASKDELYKRNLAIDSLFFIFM